MPSGTKVIARMRWAYLLAFGWFIFLGCATLNFDQDFSKPRNYLITISDEQHGPIMDITCKYVGKQPEGSFHSNVDCQAKQPDFYHYTFHNLTDQPIALLSLQSYSKFPATHTLHLPPKSQGAILHLTPDITNWNIQKLPFYGIQQLKPRETIEIRNLFYYGGIPFNIRYHELTVRWREKSYQQTFYQIYQQV